MTILRLRHVRCRGRGKLLYLTVSYGELLAAAQRYHLVSFRASVPPQDRSSTRCNWKGQLL